MFALNENSLNIAREGEGVETELMSFQSLRSTVYTVSVGTFFIRTLSQIPIPWWKHWCECMVLHNDIRECPQGY